jgi:hypothetical protein
MSCGIANGDAGSKPVGDTPLIQVEGFFSSTVVVVEVAVCAGRTALMPLSDNAGPGADALERVGWQVV